MAASGLLCERDLRALTAVVEDGLRDDPGEAMPWVVFERLQQLIPCHAIKFDELDMQGQTWSTEQADGVGGRYVTPGIPPNVRPEYWTFRARFLPYSYPMRTGDFARVLRWSDFYTDAELRDNPFHQYMRDINGSDTPRYGMIVPLPGGRSARHVAFFRYDADFPDFSERDRLALQLLRPHLHEVYLDAERRRRGVPHLSRREREVLQLAARGFSNADIARILFISPATVAKHLEHIFDRTGVRTRSAAAALALPSPLSLRSLYGK
jgi:DNA-binding CsgD family transcriptional regulator